jgi:hypothetical protein
MIDSWNSSACASSASGGGWYHLAQTHITVGHRVVEVYRGQERHIYCLYDAHDADEEQGRRVAERLILSLELAEEGTDTC